MGNSTKELIMTIINRKLNNELMTRTDLLNWAERKSAKYPALKLLKETVIDGVTLLEWLVPYGIYKGLYFCEIDNPCVDKLRNEGYGVSPVVYYEFEQSFIMDHARRLCRNGRTSRKKQNKLKLTGRN